MTNSSNFGVGSDQCRQFLKGLTPKQGDNTELWVKFGHESFYRASFDSNGNLSGIATALSTENDPLSRVDRGKPIPDLIKHLQNLSQKQDGGVFYIPTQPIGSPLADCVTTTDDIGVEMDHLDRDDQLALIAEFEQAAGLEFASTLSSGGASIHAHLKMDAHHPVSEMHYWRRLAIIAFQSDPVTERLHQPMRLPGFFRKEKGASQDLLSISDRRYTADELTAGFEKWFEHRGWEMPIKISDQWWSEVWFPLLASTNPASPSLKLQQTEQFLAEGNASYVTRRTLESSQRQSKLSKMPPVVGESISDRVKAVCDRAGVDDFPDVDWRGSGGHYRGQCPFHQGKSGNSAWLSDKNGAFRFHCSSCTADEPRDAFQYFAVRTGISPIDSADHGLKGKDYVEAAKAFLSNYGIDLPDTPAKVKDRKPVKERSQQEAPTSYDEDSNENWERRIAGMEAIEQKHGFMTSRYFSKIEDFAREEKLNSKTLQNIYNTYLSEEEDEEDQTIAQMVEESPEDIEWLIPGILVKGTTLLFHARSGCGKTLLGYNLIKALAYGTSFLGQDVTAKTRCGLIQIDEPKQALISRAKELGLDKSDIPVRAKVKWSFGQLHRLAHWIEAHKLEFILLDSFYAGQKYSQTSENDADHAAVLMRLRDIASKTNCTILIVHHSNKKDEARGTDAIVGAVSDVWHLCKPDPEKHGQYKLKPTERIFECTKTRFSKEMFKSAIAVNGDDLSWTVLDDLNKIDNDTVNTPASLAERVRAYAQSKLDPFTISELLEHKKMIGLERGNARKILNDLKKTGYVRAIATSGETIWISIQAQKNHENDLSRNAGTENLTTQAIEGVTPSVTTPITEALREENVAMQLDAERNAPVRVDLTLGVTVSEDLLNADVESDSTCDQSSSVTPNLQSPARSENIIADRIADEARQKASEPAPHKPSRPYNGPQVGAVVQFKDQGLTPAYRRKLRESGTDYPWGTVGKVTSIVKSTNRHEIIVAVGEQTYLVDNFLAIEELEPPEAAIAPPESEENPFEQDPEQLWLTE